MEKVYKLENIIDLTVFIKKAKEKMEIWNGNKIKRKNYL